MIEIAKRVLRIEAEAVLALADRIDGQFEQAVAMVLACRGRVVITGMGKSGLICQKIAATMASTGTPALFLHPAEGIHGDLGMLMKGDVVIAVSNSGETEEITRILPVIKRMGLPLIAMSRQAEEHPGPGRRCLSRYLGRRGGLPSGAGSHRQHYRDSGDGRCPGGRPAVAARV